jgi:hypothetical protein
MVAVVLVSSIACLGMLYSESEAVSFFRNGETRVSEPVVVTATQLLGSQEIPASLEIGAAGVVFRNARMVKERRIPWRQIAYWRYHGPRCECETDPAEKGCVLRIFVLGNTHSREPLYFRIAPSEACGQTIHHAMNRHHPFGGI